MIPHRTTDTIRRRHDSTTSASSGSQSDTRFNPYASVFTPMPQHPDDRSSADASSMDDHFPPLSKIGSQAPPSKTTLKPSPRPTVSKSSIALPELKGQDPCPASLGSAPPVNADHNSDTRRSDNMAHQATPPPLSVPMGHGHHRRTQSSHGGRTRKRPFIFTWKKQEIKDPLLRAKYEADKRDMEARLNADVYLSDPDHYYKDFRVQHGGFTHLYFRNPAQRVGWKRTRPDTDLPNRPVSQNGYLHSAERGGSISSPSSGSGYMAPPPTPNFALHLQNMYEHKQLSSSLLFPQTELASPMHGGDLAHLPLDYEGSFMGFDSLCYFPPPPNVPQELDQQIQLGGDGTQYNGGSPRIGPEDMQHMREERIPFVPAASESQTGMPVVDWTKVHREQHERAVSFEDDEVFCKWLPTNDTL